MSRKRQRMITGPFVMLPKRIMTTPAWPQMSPYGRLVWIELRGWLRNDGTNNGKIYAPCRDFGKAIRIDKNTVHRALSENEHYGFLVKTGEGFLGAAGRGVAAKYRFTDLAHGTHPATRDYEKWDGEMFTYTARPSRKKQNPVWPEHTPRMPSAYIEKPGAAAPLCIVEPYIGEASGCIVEPYISRLPLPDVCYGERDGPQQGSLTVRAPGQPGGVGSSPTPVAKLVVVPSSSPYLPWEQPFVTEVTDPIEAAQIRAAVDRRAAA